MDILDIVSVVIAFSALIFSIVSFQLQQDRAEKHAVASVKPILKIRSQRYIDKKSVILINAGIGPAIIRSATFSKDGLSTNKLVELFNLDIIWESFINVPENTPIRPNEEMTLVLQTAEHLKGQGLSEQDSLALLEKWQHQKSGIVVEVIYEDIFGNEQPVLKETLN